MKSRYRKEYCEDIIAYAEAGKLFNDFINDIHVQRVYLSRWARRHREFGEARAKAWEIRNERTKKERDEKIAGEKSAKRIGSVLFIKKEKMSTEAVMNSGITPKIYPHEKYRPEYCRMLVEHGENGGNFTGFYRKIGVTKTTFVKWSHKFPEFRYAKGLSLQAAQAYWWRRKENKIRRKVTLQLFRKMMESGFGK